jgi:uncharacterized membrane protein YidH (DUF202 family)
MKTFLQKPVTSSVLAVAAGLSFFFTCMLLPLVGRAGSSVPYADKNQVSFLSVLGVTLVLSALAIWAKLAQRSVDQSPLPFWSMGLCVVCVLLFALQLTGMLAI